MPPQAAAVPRQDDDATPSTVDEIRAAIDAVDLDLLALIQKRQQLTTRIGAAKLARPLKLNPRREHSVIAGLAAKASPQARAVVEPVWRELMSAGLSVQQQLRIVVWPGGRDELSRLTRARFGAQSAYDAAPTPEQAIAAAVEDAAVAVLALRPESAWWAELAATPDIWIFDSIGGRGPTDPIALVVGRVAPEHLARGVAYRVSRGGDSGPTTVPERLLGVNAGWRLSALIDNGSTPLDRDRGVVGAAAR